MRCPTLDELPPPPEGKTGWPWTEESEQLPDTMSVLSEAEGPDDRPRTIDDNDSSFVHRPSSDASRAWPRISIVTPSYNQAQFIEETIRSVLLQGYPNLEYIIIDGGSDDGSVEIIRRYEPWLTYWVSEPDRGQSHAINKGFKKVTGEIIAWLNSDDVYVSNALARVNKVAENSEAGVIHGCCKLIDESSRQIDIRRGPTSTYRLWHYWLGFYGISQPATFFRRSFLSKAGSLNEAYQYAMDYSLLLKATLITQFVYTDHCLASFRIQTDSKTNQGWLPFEIEHGQMLLGPYRENALELWGKDYLTTVQERFADALLTRICRSHMKGLNIRLLSDLLHAARNNHRIIRCSRFWKAFLLSIMGRALYDDLRDRLKRTLRYSEGGFVK
jgi:glycosyltransferase involved in cell wall biosynthesis